MTTSILLCRNRQNCSEKKECDPPYSHGMWACVIYCISLLVSSFLTLTQKCQFIISFFSLCCFRVSDLFPLSQKPSTLHKYLTYVFPWSSRENIFDCIFSHWNPVLHLANVLYVCSSMYMYIGLYHQPCKHIFFKCIFASAFSWIFCS